MSEFEVIDEYNQEMISKYPEIVNLAKSLKTKAISRGFEITDDDAVYEIVCAVEALNERRRFVPTEKELFEKKYSNFLIRMSLCSIAKYGAEGETTHSENGISRSYNGGSNYPKSLMQEIVPLARGV